MLLDITGILLRTDILKHSEQAKHIFFENFNHKSGKMFLLLPGGNVMITIFGDFDPFLAKR
jgi:hypothetical protein